MFMTLYLVMMLVSALVMDDLDVRSIQRPKRVKIDLSIFLAAYGERRWMMQGMKGLQRPVLPAALSFKARSWVWDLAW